MKLSTVNSYFLFLLTIALFFACKEDGKVPSGDAQSDTYYGEKHRPQYHFSPEANWMNDPNGMVYYEGEYHLFYQYYPDSTVWGPMHWGHAVSKDMVHWDHLPIALYPDEHGCIFSGSAVVDWDNTSGLGVGDKPPLIAIYTYHDFEKEKAKTGNHQTQGIAYSNDRGRTWEKYEGNPVLPNENKIFDFRDPKVIWYEPTNRWVMVLAAKDRLHIYDSPNLIDWSFTSEFGEGEGNHDGVWECPDLFPIKIKGTDQTKWVLIQSIGTGNPQGGSGTQYFIGEFDGKTFVNDNPPEKQLWLDQGKDNYAGVTWSDVPESDGRRLFIGWMSNWQYAQVVPTETWRSAMTLPRELELITTKQGLRVTSQPVAELSTLRKSTKSFESLDTLNYGLTDFEEDGGLYEVELSFKKPKSGKTRIEFEHGDLRKLIVYYDADNNEFGIDKSKTGNISFHQEFGYLHTAPRDYDSEDIKMRIFIDHSSIELFADDGRVVMTEIFFADKPMNVFTLIHNEMNAMSDFVLDINEYKWHELKSIWE